MNKKIKLILSGSGMLFYVHIGALVELLENGYEIVEIGGTSGGSMVAAAYASGNDTPEKLLGIARNTVPIRDGLLDPSLLSLFFRWGLIKGEKIQEVFDKYFVKDFENTKIPLHVITSNISGNEELVFSTSRTPDASITKAVRASMSIPLVFTPVKIGLNLLVDGGVTSNMALDVFDGHEDVQTVGIRFTRNQNRPSIIKNLAQYIMAIVNTFIEANMQEDMEDDPDAAIIYANSKYNGMNFFIKEEDVDAMILEGRNAVRDWLDNNSKRATYAKRRFVSPSQDIMRDMRNKK